jgi:hypothetical protein
MIPLLTTIEEAREWFANHPGQTAAVLTADGLRRIVTSLAEAEAVLGSAPTNVPGQTPSEPDLPRIKSHIRACVVSQIRTCIALLRDEDGRPETEELGYAVCKLREAVMWIVVEEHLRNTSTGC